jgi:hypothetical protein
MERATMAISSADIAKSADALNRHPDLSPAARRVGLELLARVDRRTGTAWPSEARLAEALGYDARTIRRAKAELHQLGLLTWVQRGTSWRGRTPLYRFAWDLLRTLADQLRARLKAACDAARRKSSTGRTLTPSRTLAKPVDDAPRQDVGRTFSPACLSLKKNPFPIVPSLSNLASKGGAWKAPGTPQRQHLSDQQLDSKASSRIWEALGRLGPATVAQFLDRPDADAIQDAAIKAERYQPGSGLATIAHLICCEVTA